MFVETNTFGKDSRTMFIIAASPYCLYTAALILILSASALPTASIAVASATPIFLIFSASARAVSIVCVLELKKNDICI